MFAIKLTAPPLPSSFNGMETTLWSMLFCATPSATVSDAAVEDVKGPPSPSVCSRQSECRLRCWEDCSCPLMSIKGFGWKLGLICTPIRALGGMSAERFRLEGVLMGDVGPVRLGVALTRLAWSVRQSGPWEA
ncbi:hypothetical protein COCON_G00094630 [Conger conger]|uniref:Uncharacterized protein n=1 Tax=Conger conger TaxID=82655 RepID=A0A9Q1I165_CONCO|nr:hypothetical protein COCON_G00094630 [Conger conger]